MAVIILIVLAVLIFYAFRLLIKEKTRDNYFFLSYLILIFVIIYCVSILNYRIVGNTLSVEQIKKEISQEISKKVLIDLADNYIYSAIETARLGPENLELQRTMIKKRKKAEDLYKEAGVSEKEMQEKTYKVNELIVHDIAREIRWQSIQEIEDDKKKEFESEYNDALRDLPVDLFPEKIKNVLGQYKIEKPDIKILLEQLEYFIRNKTLK